MDHNVYQYTNLFYCCLQLGVMQDLVRNLVSSPFLSYRCKNKKSDRNFSGKTLDIQLQVKSGHTKPTHTWVKSPHFWSSHPIYEIKKDYSEGGFGYLAPSVVLDIGYLAFREPPQNNPSLFHIVSK